MSLDRAKELRQKRANLWNQANEVITRASSDKRELTAEERQQVDRVHDEMDNLLSEAERLERHAELQSQLGRSQGREAGGQDGPPADPNDDGPTDPDMRDINDIINTDLRAFLLSESGSRRFNLQGALLQNSQLRDMPVYREARALGTAPGTSGGFTVPQGFHNILETALLHFGGMRQARTTIMRTASGNDLPMPTSNDTSNEGAIIGENPTDKVPEKDLTFDQETLRAHMYTSKAIRVSYQLLQDSAFDLPTYIANRLGERIGRISNRHFTVGTGENQPKGVVTSAAIGKNAASATGVTDLELIDLEHSVDIAYRQNAEWMFHDKTLRDLKKLRDEEGRPLWLPGIAVREPDTILSYRYVINNHMPEIAAGSKSILFGDFSKYHIRDVLDILFIRLDEVYAELAQVAFLAFSRHDGILLDAGTGPIKALKQAE